MEKRVFSKTPHDKHVKMQAPAPFAIETILAAVKMHGKTFVSKAPHENHVKM
jgi:hypothetical protein